jgi:hypothetical protein
MFSKSLQNFPTSKIYLFFYKEAIYILIRPHSIGIKSSYIGGTGKNVQWIHIIHICLELQAFLSTALSYIPL